MIKQIKRMFVSIATAGMLLFPALTPAMVSAAPPDIEGGLCQGAQLQVNGSSGCTDPNAETSVNNIITFVINTFSIIVAVIAVVMIIIGGIKYITSGGDANNVTSAKNTILYAVIGLVIVALAQILVRYVLSKVSTSTT